MDNSDAQAQLPQYQCHKKVWALKIAAFRDTAKAGEESDGSQLIVPTDARYAPFKVDRDYVRKHKPEIGGYYVVYPDGYKSYSPAEPFEEGYTLI